MKKAGLIVNNKQNKIGSGVFINPANKNDDSNRALNNKLKEATDLAAPGAALTDSTVEKINQISKEIMEQTRITLMMTFRFFDVALWHMDFEPQLLDAAIATDAKRVYFNPLDTAFNYKNDPNICTRNYLHSIIHCIFRQPLDDAHSHYDIWNLACDICTEAIALEMASDIFPSPRDEEAQKIIDSMISTWGTLTPHKLYKRLDEELASRDEETDKKYEYLVSLFRRDSHGYWANSPHDGENNEPKDRKDPIALNQGEKNEENREETQSLSQSDNNEDVDESDEAKPDSPDEKSEDTDNDNSDNSDSDNDTYPSQEKSNSLNSSQGINEGEKTTENINPQDNDRPPIPDIEDECLSQEWEDISKQVETMLEEYKQAWGDDFGALTANLNISNREECDYSKFLKRFAIMGEDMMINDDEFDYIFYTYGLKLYKNMPLVEPLEYKENKAIREFIIALDTSGSCQGDLIREFVDRTYEILQSTQGFGESINLHIIQCDARVQSDIKIKSLKEMEEFKENFEVRGFGGTDFRPVFNHVDKMIEEGEFENLRGLIYFTDGMGTFPKKMPKYDTAFVFVDSNGGTYHVPPWAMKVVIDEDEIFELGQD